MTNELIFLLRMSIKHWWYTAILVEVVRSREPNTLLRSLRASPNYYYYCYYYYYYIFIALVIWACSQASFFPQSTQLSINDKVVLTTKYLWRQYPLNLLFSVLSFLTRCTDVFVIPGSSELGTICQAPRSCSLAEDNGLSTAYTIAHELGHL